MSEVIEKIQQEDPTEEEISKYAEWLELDPETDEDLMWIAREGLRAELPEGWKPCRTNEGDIYYFNFSTGESMWDHPQDTHYKELARKEKAKKAQRLEKQRREQKKRDMEKKLGQVKGPGVSVPLAVVQPLAELKGSKKQKLRITNDMYSEDSESSMSGHSDSGGANILKRSTKSAAKLDANAAKLKEAKKEFKQIRKNISQMREQENELQASVSRLRTEKKDLTASNDDLRSVHTQLTDDIKMSTQAIKQLHAENADLTKQLGVKKGQLTEMTQSLQTVQGQRTDLRDELSSLNDTLTILRDQKKAMESELRELKENVQEQQAMLEQQQRTLQERSTALQRDNQPATTAVEEESSHLNISTVTSQHDTSMQLQERNKLKRELIDMREKLSSLQIQLSEQSANQSSLQRSVDELTQQRDTLQTEYDRLRNERNELVTKSNALQDELSTMTQGKLTLTNRLTQMHNEEEELIEVVSRLRREEQQLRESITQHRSQTLERESPLHIKPKSSPSSNLSKLSQDRKKLEKSIDRLRTEHESLDDELEEKQRRLQRVRQEIRDEELKHEAIITSMDGRVAKLKLQIQTLEEQKANYKKRVRQLEASVKKLQDNVAGQHNTGTTPESPKGNNYRSSSAASKGRGIDFKIHNDSDSSEQELSPLTTRARHNQHALREDDLLSLITSSLSPTFESKKLEQTVASEMQRLDKVQEFVDQEKKLIRTKKQSLEKARKEWKEDSEFNRGTVSDEVLLSVKHLLERQTQEINNDIEQLNRIQSYVTLRRKQLKLLNEDFIGSEQPQERLFHKRKSMPLGESNHAQPGDRTMIRNTLDQMRKDIDQLHRVVDTKLTSSKENVVPVATASGSSQERLFRTKWDNYFEEQRARFGGRIWDFQSQVRKWDEARSHERNLINSHEMWLRKFRRELREEVPAFAAIPGTK